MKGFSPKDEAVSMRAGGLTSQANIICENSPQAYDNLEHDFSYMPSISGKPGG